MSYADAQAEGWRDDSRKLAAQVANLHRQVDRLTRDLHQTERFWTDLANDILDRAPDNWDGDESIDHIAVQYVRALEEVSVWSIGRMPIPGDDIRQLVGAPDWADRALAESDEDRAITGDPDGEARYDADGRGWHLAAAS